MEVGEEGMTARRLAFVPTTLVTHGLRGTGQDDWTGGRL